jgi:hypothetical protein
LKRGDRLVATEGVQFATPDAVASLVSPKGRFLLKGGSGTRGGGNEAFALLKDNVLAEKPAQRLSSRAAGLLSQADVAKYISGSASGDVQQILLFEPWVMEPSPIGFPQSEQRFFFVRYTYKGELINKKLAAASQKVVITAEELYKIDGKAINREEVTNHELYYMKDGALTTIGAFEPLFADEETKESIKLMLESLKSAAYTNDKIYDELVGFLTSYVATPLEDNLKAYLKTTHGFEIAQ